ncbi:TonB-dependent receptor [uncultured Chitinophaga sp.]|uniref:TonB-dependent receptor n=1 Tax=uncultured Chitinophaga sp. TaxID=339340 RepID=UPI0025F4A172|nr:TonB-dependent receptor [uncultured Chitinophaga sp.]
MKMTALLLLVACLHISAKGVSQNVTLSLKNASLGKLFKEISRQTGVSIVYKEKLLANTSPVTINVDNAPIRQVLDEALKNQPIGYTVEHNMIITRSRPADAAPAALDTLITVNGKVSDEKGGPLPGTTVLVMGLQQATAVSAQGVYSIKNVPVNATLVFSYMGYTTERIPVNKRTVIDVVLKEDRAQLEQVVVVGYGSRKRSDVTGSISSIPAGRLSKLPVTNVLQAMQGVVAGVNISAGSNAPGRVAAFNIRGVKSIAASNNPLVVLDGTPFSGSYNDINPSDIASVDILKDVSATAIYGARGANGVVMITTKRGKTGKPVITYSGYTGIENAGHIVEPMSAAQYVQKYKDFVTQKGISNAPVVPNLAEQQNYEKGIAVNWMDEIQQQGLINNHELNISGGTDNVKYYLSGGYLKEKGILKGYQYNRFSIRSNLEANITSWLKSGTNLFFVNNNYDGGVANLYMATVMSPYGDLYGTNGDYAIYPMNPETLYTNPLLGLYNPYLNRNRNLSGNTYLELSPLISGLKYRLNVSAGLVKGDTASYTGRNMGDMKGTASVTAGEGVNWLVENILSYTKTIDKHNFDVTLLYSAQEEKMKLVSANANTFINDALTYHNLAAGQNQTTASRNVGSQLVSQMARVNYNYDSRYLFTATVRHDGYSGFGPGKKYGTFPSVALGWNITNESFMKSVPVINSLKLRASYGLSGNMGVSPYRTISQYGTAAYIYDGVTAIGVIPGTLGNKQLQWESTKGLNVGLDFSVLDSRLSGSVEAYKSNTYDLLLNRSIPVISGYSTILDNVGKTENTGLEITLNSENIRSSQFGWTTNFNISFNRNKIVDLYGDNKDDVGNKMFIGKPLRAIYDYKVIGVWQEGEDFSSDATAKPGYLKFADIDGVKGITSADRVYQGTELPRHLAGLTNTFTYRDFTLNIFLQTSQGGTKSNPTYDNRDQNGRINLPAAMPYWTSENKSNTAPSLAFENSRGYLYPVSSAYIRLKDITFSYTVPKELLNRYRIANMTAYISGRNLATITDWIGWDPEADPADRSTQQGSGYYPQVRTIIVGVNVGLQ